MAYSWVSPPIVMIIVPFFTQEESLSPLGSSDWMSPQAFPVPPAWPDAHICHRLSNVCFLLLTLSFP